MTKFVRVMDKDISNASGRKFKIGEVNISDEWDPNATTLDTIKGINFSTDESIIRWIRRGDTIYDVELPPDAEVIKCPGTFTPNGIYRTNKIIVKNPVPLTEDVVMDLYKKSNIPERTYHDVLAILAIRGFEKVCMELINGKVNENTIDEFLADYIEFGEKDIKDNNYGLYEKYKNKLFELKKEMCKNVVIKDITIRDATRDDIPEVAKLHVESWNKTYNGIIAQDYLYNMRNNLDKRIERMNNEFDLRKMIVAIVNDEIVAFSEFVYSNEFSKDLDIDCELCGLYVKNEYLGLGIGTKIFDHVITLFKKENKKHMGLWCVKENMNAINFYTKKGGKIVMEKQFTLASKEYSEVAFIYEL